MHSKFKLREHYPRRLRKDFKVKSYVGRMMKNGLATTHNGFAIHGSRDRTVVICSMGLFVEPRSLTHCNQPPRCSLEILKFLAGSKNASEVARCENEAGRRYDCPGALIN